VGYPKRCGANKGMQLATFREIALEMMSIDFYKVQYSGTTPNYI